MGQDPGAEVRPGAAEVDVEEHLAAVIQLVELEQSWVPDSPGALYIRPVMIATEPALGAGTVGFRGFMNLYSLLLDAGPGTMRRLLEAGTTLSNLSFIFLSHFHPDHSGELVPFLFAR